MTHFQWRRFQFFEIEKDVDKGSLAESLKADEDEGQEAAQVSSVTGGRGLLTVGDSLGRIHLFDRRLSPTILNAFPGTPVLLLARAAKSGLIVCVSNDCIIKIFDVDKPDKSTNLPALVRSTRVNQGQGVLPTSLAVDDDLSLVAIGFSNGGLVLIRGELRRDRGARQKSLLNGSSSTRAAISGLAFKSSKLYVTTANEVLLFNVMVRDKETYTKLDDIGCQKGLSLATEGLQEADFVMARKDAVYFYSQDGRGQCYAIEGEKCNIFWFRQYLVIVTKEAPGWTRNGEQATKEEKFILTLFDVHNKFIAYSSPIKAIKYLAAEWGLLFGLGLQDGKLFSLVEKDIQAKLDLLFKKNFYDIAIKIAKSHHYDSDGLVDIFRQYGDHLYNKGDHAAAIENYIKTIGHLEPSYVIRRFLDAHKIHYLTAYLQALHKEGLANEDHTTLLLNCYTKLKDGGKLDEFIFKDRDKVDFDVQVAIKVCRQAGYNDHAMELAKTHGLHHWYLQIALEDLKNYKEGLEYISTLNFENAEANMKKYGAILMKHLPQETTNLLKVLCTDYKPKNAPIITDKMLEDQEDVILRSNPDDFLHLFIRNNVGVLDFLESMIKFRPNDCSEVVYNNLLEHYLHHFRNLEEASDKANLKPLEDKIMAVLSNPKLTYDNDHALVLCQLHNFLRGTLHLYERKGLHSQILKLHIELGNVEAALDTCRRFGPQNPNLWIQALQLVGNIENQRAKEEHVGEILNSIEEQGLMSPLLVIRTLAGSPLANLGVVRQYLLNVYTTEQKQIKDHTAVIEQYRVDTSKVRERIHELKSQSLTIQQTKCSACNHNLELPTVHFLCDHSYHKHCFQSYSDSDTECPACCKENKKILDIVKSQQSTRDQHDTFHSQLEKAEDGFSIVAEYFGRGMFRKNIEGEKMISEKPEKIIPARRPTSPKPVQSQSLTATIPVKRGATPTNINPIVRNASPQVLSPNPSPNLGKQKQPSTSPVNPFGDPSPKNPFGSPKGSEASHTNPFGDDPEDHGDDYDESLNPFA